MSLLDKKQLWFNKINIQYVCEGVQPYLRMCTSVHEWMWRETSVSWMKIHIYFFKKNFPFKSNYFFCFYFSDITLLYTTQLQGQECFRVFYLQPCIPTGLIPWYWHSVVYEIISWVWQPLWTTIGWRLEEMDGNMMQLTFIFCLLGPRYMD